MWEFGYRAKCQNEIFYWEKNNYTTCSNRNNKKNLKNTIKLTNLKLAQALYGWLNVFPLMFNDYCEDVSDAHKR